MNEPEVKVLMLKGNDGAKVYYSSVQLSNNAKNLSLSDLTPTADSINPPAVGATVVTPNGDVYSITKVGLTKLGDGDIRYTYAVGNKLTSIKGPQGVSILMYDGDIAGSGASGQTGTVDLSKIKPNGVAKVGDIIFDHQQNAQGDVELGYWKIDSISGNSAHVVGISGGFTIPRGARGEVGPRGERGPQGVPGDISKTKISPSMFTDDLQLSAYPSVDLVDNLTIGFGSSVSADGRIWNMLSGIENSKEYSTKLGETDVFFHTFVPIVGTTYTISFEAKSTVNGDKIETFFYDDVDDSKSCVEKIDGVSGNVDGKKIFQLTSEYKRYSTTYTVNPQSRTLKAIFARCISGETKGTIYVRNCRITPGTDSSWADHKGKVSILPESQGETYFVKNLVYSKLIDKVFSTCSGLIVDDSFNPVSVLQTEVEASYIYKIEIPAGGTKLVLNSYTGYPPMVFKQTKFSANRALYSLDTLWQLVLKGKTPSKLSEVTLEHVDKAFYIDPNAKAYWQYDNSALLEADANEHAYACKPIKVNPFDTFLVTGYNWHKSNLVVILDAQGKLIKSIPGKDSYEPVDNKLFTIPSGGAYILVNDNQYEGRKTTLKKVEEWN